MSTKVKILTVFLAFPLAVTLLPTTSLGQEEPVIPASRPAEEPAPPAPAEPLMAGELLEKMMPHLVKADGEKVSIDLKQKDHVLVYWSASWCGPCRQFTPRLVEFYKQNGGGEKFEIVLVGCDRTEEKMMHYAFYQRMPWPVVSYEQRKETGALSFATRGIPCLMIINRKGEVVARGNGHAILNQFSKILADAS